MFVSSAWPDQPTQTPNSQDPARGLRRLVAGLLLVALLAAVGAFVLSQRGSSSSSPRPRPSLFPARFSETGFLTGAVRLVSSYDAPASSRRLSGSVDVRGTAFVVARCTAGTVRIVIAGLTSARPCTGGPVGVVAVKLARKSRLTASVGASQTTSWGVAIYQ